MSAEARDRILTVCDQVIDDPALRARPERVLLHLLGGLAVIANGRQVGDVLARAVEEAAEYARQSAQRESVTA